MTIGAALALVSAGLAGLLALAMLFHDRRTLAPWFFLAGMGLFCFERLFAGISGFAASPAELRDWETWRILGLSLVPGTWVLFTMTYARGDSRQALSRSAWYVVGLFVVPLATALWSRLDLVRVASFEPESAPSMVLLLTPPARLIHLLVLLGSVLVLMNLERVFRAAVGTMRWRIKFMVLGLGVLFAVLAYVTSQALLFGELNPDLQVLFSGAVLAASLLVTRSLFRSGHFEVSVYPSQLVLHNSLTVLLAGVYLVIVGLLAKASVILGDTGSFPLRAFLVLVGLVTLSVLLLSDRMRLQTRRFVSRNFQRPLYDYRTVWRTFAESTARCLDEKQLCSTVVKLTSDIFQALSVSIWLVDERRESLQCAGSSFLRPDDVRLQAEDSTELLRAFENRSDPVDIDSSREFWASALRRAHPDEFRKGGNRLAVPLKAGGELLGIIALGDRVGGAPFSFQETDLLKAISDQVASSLLNIKLAQKLSQAKQLEAFQAMSAFFVHDLKNTASTLSLMLRNLPVHYADPQFREDALRGIASTVSHINDLVSRLTVLRHELTVQAVDCDLNGLLQESLKVHEQTTGPQLKRDLQPLPALKIDPGQMQKVFTNLLLNAKEAVGPAGQVNVQTRQSNGWAVVSVSDDGCGMTREFIDSRLFRPFQTTKKRGIGIGMFHCKMIVEAHRGRIEVQSEPGKGTTFRVLLPLAPAPARVAAA